MYCEFSSRNVRPTSTLLGSVPRNVTGASAEIPGAALEVFKLAKGTQWAPLSLDSRYAHQVLSSLERGFI